MQNMKKELVEKVLAEVDANQNESITFDEFVELILEYLQKSMPDYVEATVEDIIDETKEVVK